MLASYLLTKWVYPNETSTIDETDKRWVGCWYVGFVISSACMLVLSALIVSFPDAVKSSLFDKPENNTDIDSASKSKEKRRTRKLNEQRKLAEYKLSVRAQLSCHGDDDSLSTTTTVASEPLPPPLPTPPTMNAETMNAADTDRPPVLERIDESTLEKQEGEITVTVGDDAPNKVTTTTTNAEGGVKPSSWLASKWLHVTLRTKGLAKSLLRLVTNMRYVLLVAIISLDSILASIFTKYMVLYTQNVYQLTGSTSAIYVGGVVVPAAIVGVLFGGLVVKRFNLHIEGTTRLIMSATCLVIGGLFILLFIRCQASPSIGIDSSSLACNRNCNCLSTVKNRNFIGYSPVCGVDGLTYVSPCYAGCLAKTGNVSLLLTPRLDFSACIFILLPACCFCVDVFKLQLYAELF